MQHQGQPVRWAGARLQRREEGKPEQALKPAELQPRGRGQSGEAAVHTTTSGGVGTSLDSAGL